MGNPCHAGVASWNRPDLPGAPATSRVTSPATKDDRDSAASSETGRRFHCFPWGLGINSSPAGFQVIQFTAFFNTWSQQKYVTIYERLPGLATRIGGQTIPEREKHEKEEELVDDGGNVVVQGRKNTDTKPGPSQGQPTPS